MATLLYFAKPRNYTWQAERRFLAVPRSLTDSGRVPRHIHRTPLTVRHRQQVLLQHSAQRLEWASRTKYIHRSSARSEMTSTVSLAVGPEYQQNWLRLSDTIVQLADIDIRLTLTVHKYYFLVYLVHLVHVSAYFIQLLCRDRYRNINIHDVCDLWFVS